MNMYGWCLLRLLEDMGYPDDFVCICRVGAESQTDRMVRFLFRTLGWKLSEEPGKNKPFSTFQALGVELNLEKVPVGESTVGNAAAKKMN